VIGNDIVDLNLAKEGSNWERKRYLSKLFTAQERIYIHESKDSCKMLWRLWSMKESGYKLFLQTGGSPFYNPSKIECKLLSDSLGRIQIDTFSLETQSIENYNYILSNAKKDFKENFRTEVFLLEGKKPSETSSFCYSKVKEIISKEFGYAAHSLSLSKSSCGAPVLSYQDKLLDISISLSHHGSYGVFSYCLS